MEAEDEYVCIPLTTKDKDFWDTKVPMASWSEEDVFFTHYNSSRPLCVTIHPKEGVQVYKEFCEFEAKRQSETKDDYVERTVPWGPKHVTGFYSARPVHSWPAKSIKTIFIGNREAEEDDDPEWDSFSKGHSVLLELTTGSCILLGTVVQPFEPPEPVVGMHSLIGNNDFVYGVVFTENYAAQFQKVRTTWVPRSSVDETSKDYGDWWASIEKHMDRQGMNDEDYEDYEDYDDV